MRSEKTMDVLPLDSRETKIGRGFRLDEVGV